jgi:hypothetical protein
MIGAFFAAGVFNIYKKVEAVIHDEEVEERRTESVKW